MGMTDAASGAANREIEDCPELNLSNYVSEDVDRLNDWAIRADKEIDRLYAALASAPAQPVAEPAQVSAVESNTAVAALPDERAAFEARFPVPGGVSWSGSGYVVEDDYINSYRCDRFIGQWAAWQARAAINADRAAQWGAKP